MKEVYVCENCGAIFEEGGFREVRDTHGFSDGYAEIVCECPVCDSQSIVTQYECAECREPFDEDELYAGFCADCLRLQCAWDRAIAYLKQRNLVGAFFCWWLNGDNQPDSFKMDFLCMAEEYIQNNKSDGTLAVLQSYIMDDKSDFADWLEQIKQNENGGTL